MCLDEENNTRMVAMTPQAHERLIYEGKWTTIAGCPPLPKEHPHIRLATDEEDCGLITHTTSCWRRYIGTWKIKGGKFYLVGLWGKYRLTDGEPVFADWFTGVLRIPQGKVIHEVYVAYGSFYEEELYLKVEKGVVVKSRLVDYRDHIFDRWSLGGECPTDFD